MNTCGTVVNCKLCSCANTFCKNAIFGVMCVLWGVLGGAQVYCWCGSVLVCSDDCQSIKTCFQDKDIQCTHSLLKDCGGKNHHTGDVMTYPPPAYGQYAVVTSTKPHLSLTWQTAFL